MKVTAHQGAGVEITDLDLRALNDDSFEELRALFAHHGLLFIRDQQLSEDDHIAFAERFGTINVNLFEGRELEADTVVELRQG